VGRKVQNSGMAQAGSPGGVSSDWGLISIDITVKI
jgi:hypothetical protein